MKIQVVGTYLITNNVNLDKGDLKIILINIHQYLL